MWAIRHLRSCRFHSVWLYKTKYSLRHTNMMKHFLTPSENIFSNFQEIPQAHPITKARQKGRRTPPHSVSNTVITTELPVLHQTKPRCPRTTETNPLRAGIATPTHQPCRLSPSHRTAAPVLTSNRCPAPPAALQHGAAAQAGALRAERCGCQRLTACQSAGGRAVPCAMQSKAVSPRRNRPHAPNALRTVQGKSEPQYSWNTSRKITSQRFPRSLQVRPTEADTAGRAGPACPPARRPHGPAHTWGRAGG